MGDLEESHESERLFTLAEANCLIPQLEELCTQIKQSRTVLVQTRDEIKKASSKSYLGGGSVAGPRYIHALQQINESLQTIHELGVLVKDVEMGLCDFPYMMNGRVVYLCWKLGEENIHWWHDIEGGYEGRQALPEDAA